VSAAPYSLLAQFNERHSNLEGHERLKLFEALPQAEQDAAFAQLGRALQFERWLNSECIAEARVHLAGARS
jgi:hypothetical protein